MAKQKYVEMQLGQGKLDIIGLANQIVDEYDAMGYRLTLRQLYYQFISRDWFPATWADKETGSTNNKQSYKKLTNYISDARLAGLMDWDAIEDRTRNLEGLGHWTSPADILTSAEYGYRRDKWLNQDWRVEIWIEKDALRGVVSQIANTLDIPHFACRGYSSQSEMREAGQRIKRSYLGAKRKTLILHLGDHDPSGIDMTRDNVERLEMFSEAPHGRRFELIRVALNYNQVEQYDPPPNFAKETDSRFGGYQREFGEESWELDALSPTVISDLIRDAVAPYRDDDRYNEQQMREEEERLSLRMMRLKYKVDNGLSLTEAERETWIEETGEEPESEIEDDDE